MKPRKLEDGKPSRFEYLARGVEIATAKRVQALDLSGIGVHRDERREVPGDDLAANLIGFTSQDMAGLDGLEARYDECSPGRTASACTRPASVTWPRRSRAATARRPRPSRAAR